MAIKQDPNVPAMPAAFKKKLQEEETDMKFKGKSGSITFLEPAKAKSLKLNKINMGQGKDIFVTWEKDDLLVWGWTEKHQGKDNKTYEGYLMGKSLQTIKIK